MLRIQKRQSVSWEAYVGFSATAGEIEVQGDPQVFKSLQVISKAFSRKLPQGVLVPLGCLFHLPFLKDTWRTKHTVRRTTKPEGKCWGERSRAAYSPDTPNNSWALPSHQSHIQHTHTGYTWLVCPFCHKPQSIKCQPSIIAPLLNSAEHTHPFIFYIKLRQEKK